MITLTIPNDDTIALRQFGRALIEIASEKDGHPVDVTVTPLVISTDVNAVESGINPEITDAYMQGCRDTEERLRAATETLQQAAQQMVGEPEVDTTAQQVESLGATHIITEQKLVGDPVPVGDGNLSQGYIATVEEIADPVDSTGTPWDERIHSTSKALNADGTWRLRRKPKDMDEAEWTALIESVKGELLDKENKDFEEWEKTKQPDYLEPSVAPESAEISEPTREEVDELIEASNKMLEPPVTPPGDDFHTDASVVTEQTVAGIPPLPVPPPVVVAPPVPEVTTWDFPRLMTFLTERHGKIDVATVNTLLAQDGMSSVQELNAHPDKIGPFVARVKAHLGE